MYDDLIKAACQADALMRAAEKARPPRWLHITDRASLRSLTDTFRIPGALLKRNHSSLPLARAMQKRFLGLRR